MNYKEYFIKCRDNFAQENKPSLDFFYQNPVFDISFLMENVDYMKTVNILGSLIKNELDKSKSTDIMIKEKDIWKYRDEIVKLSNFIVPILESERYGCNLYVDKIYIYRTTNVKRRSSSYLWHFDNNPQEIVKTIIYLNDVTVLNSPFEFLANKDKVGYLHESSRKGPKEWNPPRNNSRISKEEMNKLESRGYSGFKVLGPKGTTICFNNNAIHRANPVLEGYRDVINIRVKPTLEKRDYVDKRWTSGFEKSGAVNPNPEKIKE